MAKVLAALANSFGGRFRGSWGYLFAAAGNIITFFLLFQPWIHAAARDGKIDATPFGRLHVTSTLVSLWSGSPPPAARINGMWAILASIAVTVTVCTVVVNLRARNNVLCRLATGSSVALAIFVAAAIVHMNGKAPDVRRMLSAGSTRDLGTQAGLLLRWASGNGSYPLPGVHQVSYSTAGLTTYAWVTGAIAVASAIAAVAQLTRERTTGSIRLSWRSPIVTSRPSPPDHAN
ncbi:hypothetical protein [Nocardia australiensis]|uniref:hypothetical protein n=1 Tax=Nocardia australiensis TaxID=2887191 RepID=UPI001D14E28C|nr:hypothetical protein [Nocardia australiensis]